MNELRIKGEVVFLCFLTLVTFISFCSGLQYEKALVVEVVDGDTIRIENGELVRLLGINAPEKGQRFYEDAKRRLEELLEGKEVLLEKDVTNRDIYGRLLRYVYVNGTLVNLIIVKEGLAYAYKIENLKYEEDFKKAEYEARALKLGIWNRTWNCSDCIGIAYFEWDAKGDDCMNPNGEFVVLKNFCWFSCNLTSWSVSDESGNVFVFPELLLEGGSSVTLYSGCGQNKENEFYFCSNLICKAIWNNDGDTLYLRNSENETVLQYTYRR